MPMKYTLTSISIVLLGHLIWLSGCSEPPVSVPYISSFSPDTAALGVEIQIFGKNFSDDSRKNIVRINGGDCEVISASSTELVVKTIPGVSTGPLTVTVGVLAAVAFDEFSFVPHQLDSINPKVGAPGTTVDFFGINFPEPFDGFDPLQDIAVTFNDKVAPVTNYTNVDAKTKTFSVKVPEDAESGTVSVTIGAVTETYKDDFEVIR